jgi:hypothetical protein
MFAPAQLLSMSSGLATSDPDLSVTGEVGRVIHGGGPASDFVFVPKYVRQHLSGRFCIYGRMSLETVHKTEKMVTSTLLYTILLAEEIIILVLFFTDQISEGVLGTTAYPLKFLLQEYFFSK